MSRRKLAYSFGTKHGDQISRFAEPETDDPSRGDRLAEILHEPLSIYGMPLKYYGRHGLVVLNIKDCTCLSEENKLVADLCDQKYLPCTSPDPVIWICIDVSRFDLERNWFSERVKASTLYQVLFDISSSDGNMQRPSDCHLSQLIHVSRHSYLRENRLTRLIWKMKHFRKKKNLDMTLERALHVTQTKLLPRHRWTWVRPGCGARGTKGCTRS